MQELNTLAHQLDPSRSTSLRRCDFARDIPDVYSPSIWAGWYRGTSTPEYQEVARDGDGRSVKRLRFTWNGAATATALRHSENPDAALWPKLPPVPGTDERGLDYLPTGGEPRVIERWRLVGDVCLQSVRLAFEGTGDAAVADRRGAMDIQGLHNAATSPRIRCRAVNQKGVVERDLTPEGKSYYVFQSYWSGCSRWRGSTAIPGRSVGATRAKETGEGLLELSDSGAVLERQVGRRQTPGHERLPCCGPALDDAIPDREKSPARGCGEPRQGAYGRDRIPLSDRKVGTPGRVSM